MISQTGSIQPAEMQALIEEQKTQNKIAEKEKKLKEFRAKTASTAQQNQKKQKIWIILKLKLKYLQV